MAESAGFTSKFSHVFGSRAPYLGALDDRAMGYNEDGVWLGDCPSFELDTESCCVSLNMCAAARQAGTPWRQTAEPTSHTFAPSAAALPTLTLSLTLTSIPILVNAALLFIVTNCTCGWAVVYLLAEPAVFALILMVVRLSAALKLCTRSAPKLQQQLSRLQPIASQVVTDGEMCLVAGLAFQAESAR